MVDLREIWAWFVFYLMASLFSLGAAILILSLFWPNYDANEQSSTPVEQQLYLLLVDRGYWISGHPRDAEFSDGMTKDGRQRFAHLLSEIRFKADCLGQRKKIGQAMTCVVNGEEIDFISHD